MIRSQILKRKLVPSPRFPFTLPGSTLVCAAPFLACLGAAPALAASPVTFVSGKGADTGDCASPANPCRSFKFAIGQTNPGGEIKALDPANYGGVTIAQSISITINAGASDVVNLSHLTLDGLKIAQEGILFNSGGSLTISHCVVRNFSRAIDLDPTGATKFLIGDTLVSDNGRGITVAPRGAGSAQGTLDHVSANRTGNGIAVSGSDTSGAPIDVTSVDSIATNNGTGFIAQHRGVLRLAHSAATGNIAGNGSDVSGTLTPVATK